jgi:predicted DCC family thiol-disulfide oxidoreductase YuxK
MRRLRWLDRQQRIRFTDIATPAFEAEAIGVSWATLMTRVHARLPDGGMVHGTEAFRRLYSAVGLGPVVALTRLPGIRQLADLAYRWVARHRMQLGGKCRDGGRDTHS